MKSYELKSFLSSKYELLAEDVPSGSRPRIVVRHKSTGQKSLIKTYKRSPRELWAEMFASKFGALLGFDVQNVSMRRADDELTNRMRSDYGEGIADDWDRLVVQVNYLLPQETNFKFGSQYIKRSPGEDELFSLDEIEEAFRSAYPTTDDLVGGFAKMVIFDFLIGNSDRHRDNWAIAIRDNYPSQLQLFRLSPKQRNDLQTLRRFATLFDHGDSTLYELTDADVARIRSEGERAMNRYILNKQVNYLCSQNRDVMSLYDVIREKTSKPASSGDKWRDSLRSATTLAIRAFNYYSVAKLVIQMPHDDGLCYTEERKDLLLRLTMKKVGMLEELL